MYGGRDGLNYLPCAHRISIIYEGGEGWGLGVYFHLYKLIEIWIASIGGGVACIHRSSIKFIPQASFFISPLTLPLPR